MISVYSNGVKVSKSENGGLGYGLTKRGMVHHWRRSDDDHGHICCVIWTFY